MKIPSFFPVACHTRYVGPGSTFVAIRGYNQDGIAYISQAILQGATTIVVQEDVELPSEIEQVIEKNGVRLMRVDDARRALAQLSAQANGFPANQLKIIGITGTKGKTTSTFLLEHVLRSAGHKVALVSTVKNSIDGIDFPMQLTTPQPDYLHMFFRLCVDAGIEYVVMEVAAQALTLFRVEGLVFDAVIFTNFDKEHAEFYPTLEEYFDAKYLIFKHLKKDATIFINGDDLWCKKILEKNPTFSSFGLHEKGMTVRAEIVGTVRDAITFKAHWTNRETYTISCPALIGLFNVYNILGVTSIALRLGLPIAKIQHACETFSKVPGRLEQYHLPNGARCFIDYAHNPSSYQAVLSTLRELTDNLIVVFGCGGDRDQGKRPLMGAVAAEIADRLILTSDNPRSEDPKKIIEDIESGISADSMHKVQEELDREKAIKKAYALSCAGSIIVLLGKGPDEYQQIGTVKYPFSEAAIIRNLTLN